MVPRFKLGPNGPSPPSRTEQCEPSRHFDTVLPPLFLSRWPVMDPADGAGVCM